MEVCSKYPRKPRRKIDPYRVAAIALGIYGFGMPAEAQLVGGKVVAGQAAISSPSAAKTVIQQTSNRAIYSWSSFSIPTGSSVQFIEPSATSIALNRVLGGGASVINGSLSSNGQVVLINSAGIIVGSGAQVSVAGIILSTADIGNANFMTGAGSFKFGIPGQAGAGISNAGSITVSGGSAILAGQTVSNSGVIVATAGTVVLAGTKTYAVDFVGDGLLKFAVTRGVDAVAPGTEALVENTGTVSAPGGEVLMTARAAKGVLDNVINTSGIVEATSVARIDGKIVLLGEGRHGGERHARRLGQGRGRDGRHGVGDGDKRHACQRCAHRRVGRRGRRHGQYRRRSARRGTAAQRADDDGVAGRHD